MKKTLLILLAMFLSIGMFTSCEEEEEPAQMKLSDFIVGGNWVYTELDYSNPTHVITTIFTGDFYQDGTYDLIVREDMNFVTFNGTYTIDDVLDKLTISNPFYEEGLNDEFTLFSVEWEEGIEEMYWTDLNDVDGEAMTWERTYEE